MLSRTRRVGRLLAVGPASSAHASWPRGAKCGGDAAQHQPSWILAETIGSFAPFCAGIGARSLYLGPLVALLLVTLPGIGFTATNRDPDWPCVQRKVPELSLGQIWNGPDLPASANNWSKDAQISDLVRALAARRVPVADAQRQIRDFAATLPAGQSANRLSMLVQGLFDHMNAERSQIVSGIGRYARKQIELAARLRKQAAELDALRGKADADAGEVAARLDKLAGETRIFDERVQSLTYVCEVPTLIEQRLYALAKTVAELMGRP